MTPVGPGSCRVTIAADSFDWPAFGLAALGAEFTPPPQYARAAMLPKKWVEAA